MGPKNRLLEKTTAKTAKALDAGCPRVLWKKGPHVRVGCPERASVASLHPGALAAASKETGGEKRGENAAAAPAISDRPDAVACAKVENFAQAKKPHV